MIPPAPDLNSEQRVLHTLQTVWFVALATAFPLIDFVRSSSALSLAGALTGGLFLAVLIATHLFILRIGPQVLSYEERFRDLYIQTALRQYRIPVRSLRAVHSLEGSELRYRHGVSVQGYHVGTFYTPAFGNLQVAASSLAGTGLVIDYTAHFFPRPRPSLLFISPDEPLATKLALESLMQEQAWRIALGQP